MRLRRLHALLALAACAAISCAPASGQQSTISKDIEGRLFFPISRAPPISSIQVHCQKFVGVRTLRCVEAQPCPWKMLSTKFVPLSTCIVLLK